MTTPTLHAKVADVARFLHPWRPDNGRQPARGAILVHPDIEDAYLHFGAYGDRRIEIRGGFPHDFYPRAERRPQITVSAQRSAKSIAGDIVRRFLPVYIPLFEEMEAQAAAWERNLTQRNLALDELARALGVDVDRHHDLNHLGEIRHYGPDHVRVIATTSGSDGDLTADLRLDRLPMDVARRVCEVVMAALQVAR